MVPYLIERFAFEKRFGVFATLFWLLALQFLTIYTFVPAGEFLEDNGWNLLGELFRGTGAFAFMTLGVIPFIALPLSILAALVVLATRQFRQVR
ncbi:hypothetical protein EJ069_22030 [Mesorhizobium sp. M2A.F.Ca.ET.043.05.1.1]|uniref:hypothetical protein n=1 Tax=Mesorhizobium sp. M2A.F.Ca.ET.043.05.1.1 TaxID=2493671 RepID=UPI000F765C3F|nr:hypothetical protein [Mesorhizobium sp. M2A.F.Ca.ET.043.05.1.1]AZO17154.1 hypothetical protein EJ069_22030 [Mesorhizobium sp. M2A.F.Ca.ET.043.05.1.1]